MHNRGTVLVACSDEEKLGFLCHQLAADGHPVDGASTARAAAAKARGRPPQVLVLGPLEQPLEQLALLRAIRTGDAHGGAFDPAVAVIALGAAGGELELGRYSEAGSDDYLAPPGSYPELRARLAALLRRLQPRAGVAKRIGPLAIDPHSATASYAGRPLALTRMEFALLNHLATDPTRVATKQELLRDVWQFRSQGKTRTVDAHIARLRRKLAAAGGHGLVQTVWGVGYRLHDRPASAPATAAQPRLAAA